MEFLAFDKATASAIFPENQFILYWFLKLNLNYTHNNGKNYSSFTEYISWNYCVSNFVFSIQVFLSFSLSFLLCPNKLAHKTVCPVCLCAWTWVYNRHLVVSSNLPWNAMKLSAFFFIGLCLKYPFEHLIFEPSKSV